MKVLVVDDSRIVRNSIASLLWTIPAVTGVIQAADACEAERLLETEKPDVITLDLCLPGKSGLKVLREVRKQSPRIAVVVLTNRSDPEHRHTCMGLGADSFLDKSRDLDKLESVLDRIARIRRAGKMPGEKKNT